jgi:hypothetical protein
MKTALLLASTLAACTGLAAAQEIGMKEHAGLRWACGGAGVEERAALATLRPQANVELLFVTAKRGGYLADVEVSVYAADKTAPVLQVTAEGPICMISAPAAKYRIEASYGGVKRSAQIAADKKLARVVFGFPEEPWDGIRASDEEKQQARQP